jgi:hypothetical protein
VERRARRGQRSEGGERMGGSWTEEGERSGEERVRGGQVKRRVRTVERGELERTSRVVERVSDETSRTASGEQGVVLFPGFSWIVSDRKVIQQIRCKSRELTRGISWSTKDRTDGKIMKRGLDVEIVITCATKRVENTASCPNPSRQIGAAMVVLESSYC